LLEYPEPNVRERTSAYQAHCLTGVCAQATRPTVKLRVHSSGAIPRAGSTEADRSERRIALPRAEASSRASVRVSGNKALPVTPPKPRISSRRFSALSCNSTRESANGTAAELQLRTDQQETMAFEGGLPRRTSRQDSKGVNRRDWRASEERRRLGIFDSAGSKSPLICIRSTQGRS
jgi:hypothetical protein